MRRVRAWIRNYPHIKYLWFFPVYLAVYFLAERLITTDYWVSYLPLDDSIPFLPIFVVPYDLWYPAMLAIGVYLLLRDADGFQRYMKFLFFGFYICEIIWLLFPNGQDLRPALTGRESVFTWIISNLYAADTNTNVLPSAHVVGAVAVAAATWNCPALGRRRLLQAGVAAVCFLIAVSTVFIKQHSILDVFAAVAVCLPLYCAFYLRRPAAERSPGLSRT